MYKNFFKRLIDFTLSLIGLIILSPLFIIVTIALAIANGGKPFFLQPRPGRYEKVFKVIKFKSMNDKKDANGNLLPDALRMTKAGSFVRKTSLDEIPQLINVLKGDMSLIGPRPLLVQYLPLYNSEQKRRHEVRPGITGWAQVNGRNLMKLSSKFEHDVWYVDNISFSLDLKIIMMTLKNVIAAKDVGDGSGNMKEVDDLGFMEKIKNKPIKISDKLSLRYPELNDTKQLLTLKNNARATLLLGGHTITYTEDLILEWIKLHLSTANENLFVIHDIESDKLIGHVGLYNIDLNAKKAEFGILIADDDSHGKGFGSMCLEYMLNYGFNILKLNKISLSYLNENKVAERLYLKYGFNQEGVLVQEQFKNNQYYDVILMAKFNPNNINAKLE